jgi:hypothetical protein
MKNYFLILHDGTKFEINEEEANKIMELSSSSNAKFIKIKGVLINFSSISQILPVEEFHEQHPKLKPIKIGYLKLPNYKSYAKLYLNSEQRLEKAIAIWKRQRDNNEVQINTGGLNRLIKWAENRLFNIKK